MADDHDGRFAHLAGSRTRAQLNATKILTGAADAGAPVADEAAESGTRFAHLAASKPISRPSAPAAPGGAAAQRRAAGFLHSAYGAGPEPGTAK